MLTTEAAEHFKRARIEAWNAHNLDAILAHYAENIEFTSPFVARLCDEPSGTIHGKEKLRAYFGKALQAYPYLHFEAARVLVGVESFTLCYQSVKNLQAAEVMSFDPGGKVVIVLAHYSA